MNTELCSSCGSNESLVGKQIHEGKVIPEKSHLMITGETLYHVICKNCGTVIRSFVKDPDNLKKGNT